MQLHPLCTLFPRMEGPEFGSLVADIRANGLRQPIIVHDEMILDGGNRFRACVEAGIPPRYESFKGDSLVSFVLSANLHRRHMTAGQQAAIVAAATDWGRVHKHGGDRRSDQAEGLPLETVAKRAAVSGATERTQREAEKLTREHPEQASEVRQGRKSLYKAAQETTPAKPVQPKPASDLDTLKTRIAELEAELIETKDALDDAQDLASSLMRANDVGMQKRFDELMSDIKTIKRSRDDALNENAQLKKEVKRYMRKLGINP